MKGKSDLVTDERPRDANVIDLMERLRESLSQSGSGQAKKTVGTKARKACARAQTAAQGSRGSLTYGNLMKRWR